MTHIYIIIFLLNIIPRIFFILFFPETGGDYEIYTAVAENILNGCGVSLSDPSTGECIPHFGGNHGPGYPVFISLIWSAFNHSDTAVRITQAVIYSISCLWLCYGIYNLTNNKKLLILFGLVLAFSPLTMAYYTYEYTN